MFTKFFDKNTPGGNTAELVFQDGESKCFVDRGDAPRCELRGRGVENPIEVCEDVCYNMGSRCSHFVTWERGCYFKSSDVVDRDGRPADAEMQHNPYTNVYAKNRPHAKENTDFWRQSNVDVRGSDYRTVVDATRQTCEEECIDDHRCWAFVAMGDTCYLKSREAWDSVPQFLYKDDTVLYTKIYDYAGVPSRPRIDEHGQTYYVSVENA